MEENGSKIYKKEKSMKSKIETTYKIAESGLVLHKKTHGRDGIGGSDNKSFHDVGHPEKLIKRSKKIAEILNLPLEKTALLEIILAYHDAIIEYDKPEEGNILGMLKRHRGAREGDQPSGINGNEAKSVALAAEKMKASGAFAQEEINIVVLAIDATYPEIDLGKDFQGAEFNNYAYYEIAVTQSPILGELIKELGREGFIKGPLFFQPHLEKTLENNTPIPLEVVITGLVDMGGAGCEDNQEFFKEGDAEMREIYYNVRQLENLKRLMMGSEKKDTEDREKIAKEFLKWSESQVGFATWQALRFEKIMRLLNKNRAISEDQEKGLRDFFSHYVENIKAALNRSKELKRNYEETAKTDEKQAFISLLQNMGYEKMT